MRASSRASFQYLFAMSVHSSLKSQQMSLPSPGSAEAMEMAL